jgi:hypothetical protein
MLVYLFFVQGFLSSHELSGVWSHMPGLGLLDWLRGEYETSWGTVDVNDACIIFDFETNDWYMSDPLGFYRYVPIAEIKKEPDGSYIIKIDPEYMLQQTSDYEDTYRVVFLSGSKNKIDVNKTDPAKYALTGHGQGEYDKISGPPKPNMADYEVTHTTTDNLKVRITPELSSRVPAVLEKGTPVQVLEYGPAETISGVTATWVRILTGDGDTGWCFSAYLEEIKEQTAAVESKDEESKDAERTADAQQLSSTVSFLQIVFGGGIILVILLTVLKLTVLKKK